MFSLGALAQESLTEAGKKAQRSLIEYLRLKGMSPSIDTRDNSVNFKSGGVLYWVTFKGDTPVQYTIHRKGLNLSEDKDYSTNCALYACNAVNRKHVAKSSLKDKRVEFIFQSYAKEPSDFHGGFTKMLEDFKNVVETFDAAYKEAKSHVNTNVEIKPTGATTLDVTYIAFANFDAAGKMISDYNQPLRKSDLRYVKPSIDVSTTEKGIFSIGVRIYDTNGKLMRPNSGTPYTVTTSVELGKKNKTEEADLDQYGSDEENFWKAGEYSVEIYDAQKGVKLYTTSFNVL